jgi:hypothetical protein
MRLMLLAVMVSAWVMSFAVAAPTDAAGVPFADGRVTSHQQVQQPVDQHDGSRVEVQLVVAGIVAGLVVGVGTGAYLLRRKLGLTAYSPEQAGGGHH